MYIKNFQTLATSALRKDALLIAEAGLSAVDTREIFKREFVYNSWLKILTIGRERFFLPRYKRIFCLALGKSAFAGITQVANSLGNKLSGGVALDVSATLPLIPRVTCYTGDHPHPTARNVENTRQVMKFVQNLTADDLVICLISGGGSALLCNPFEIGIEEKSQIIKTLMLAGADILEMNTVRKHLSQIKGGQLAQLLYPAKLVNVFFSDVPGDDLNIIASGPTVKDMSTNQDAQRILNKYDVLQKLNLKELKLKETPKAEQYFKQTRNILLVSSRKALQAMQATAEDLGYEVKIFSQSFQGEVTTLANTILTTPPIKLGCVLGAGESTVTVVGSGKGGRNQELALRMLQGLKANQVFLSLASDGHDNSEFAGALVDTTTLHKAQNLNLHLEDYLKQNNSFEFLAQVGDFLDTGLTGINIADLFIWLNK